MRAQEPFMPVHHKCSATLSVKWFWGCQRSLDLHDASGWGSSHSSHTVGYGVAAVAATHAAPLVGVCTFSALAESRIHEDA
jgi:hypothetical protein